MKIQEITHIESELHYTDTIERTQKFYEEINRPAVMKKTRRYAVVFEIYMKVGADSFTQDFEYSYTKNTGKIDNAGLKLTNQTPVSQELWEILIAGDNSKNDLENVKTIKKHIAEIVNKNTNYAEKEKHIVQYF